MLYHKQHVDKGGEQNSTIFCYFFFFSSNSSNAHSKKLVRTLCPQPLPDVPCRHLHSTKKPSRMRCGASPLTNRIWHRRVVESLDETSGEKSKVNRGFTGITFTSSNSSLPSSALLPSGKCLSKCTRWNLRRQMYHKRFKGRHKTKLGFNRCLPGGTEKTTKALQRQHLGGARAKNTAQLQNSCANQKACMYISAYRTKSEQGTQQLPWLDTYWLQPQVSLVHPHLLMQRGNATKHNLPLNNSIPSQQLSPAMHNVVVSRQDPHVSAGQALQGEDKKLST